MIFEILMNTPGNCISQLSNAWQPLAVARSPPHTRSHMSAYAGRLVPQPESEPEKEGLPQPLAVAGYCRAANIFSSTPFILCAELLMFDICFGFIFNACESRATLASGLLPCLVSPLGSTWDTSVDVVIQKLIAWIEWQQLAECGRVLPKC